MWTDRKLHRTWIGATVREFNELLEATEPGVLTTKLHHCRCVIPAPSKTGVVLEKKCASYSLTGTRKNPAQYVSNPLLSFACITLGSALERQAAKPGYSNTPRALHSSQSSTEVFLPLSTPAVAGHGAPPDECILTGAWPPADSLGYYGQAT